MSGNVRDELAREADLARSRLLNTVEQLDQRRHDAFDLQHQIHTHIRQLVIVGAVAVATSAGAVGLIVHRVVTAPDRRRRARWSLAVRLWQNPERALRAHRSAFWVEGMRSLALTLVTSALAIPAKRLIARFGAPPPPASPATHASG